MGYGPWTRMDRLLACLACALLAATASALEAAQPAPAAGSPAATRNPKLFFVTTSFSTSSTFTTTTVTTTTFCYTRAVPANALTTCTRRKKRLVLHDPLTGEETGITDLSPQGVTRVQREAEVEDSELAGAEEHKRDPKTFFTSTVFSTGTSYGLGAWGWYYLTTTSTTFSTSTSTTSRYTATAFISAVCTPAGTNSACG